MCQLIARRGEAGQGGLQVTGSLSDAFGNSARGGWGQGQGEALAGTEDARRALDVLAPAGRGIEADLALPKCH